MKQGTTVEVVTPVIRGVIVERRLVNDAVECLVEWTEDDQPVRRWYAEAQLKEVPK